MTSGTAADTEATPNSDKSQAVRKTLSALIPCPRVGDRDAWSFADTVKRPPPIMAKGKDATLTDLDGNKYVDYVCAGGSLILGHADERVVAAISKTASKGFGFGGPSVGQMRLAELIASRCAAVDMVRFTHSRVDAVKEAVAIARAVTGRDGVIVCGECQSCDNGPVPTGVLSAVIPASVQGSTPGGPIDKRDDSVSSTPRRDGAEVFLIPHNDTRAAEELVREQGSRLSAIVVEPVATTRGLAPPKTGYLAALRGLCDRCGALMVWDEGVTGFRIAPGGASMLYGVAPDLTCFGPVIGGGLRLAAYGGRKELLKDAAKLPWIIADRGPTGLELSVAAGIATLQALSEPGFYEELEAKSARLAEGLQAAAGYVSVKVLCERVGSLLCMHFTDERATDSASAFRADAGMYATYFHLMLERGVLLPASSLAFMSVSAAHGDEQIEQTIETAYESLGILAGKEATPNDAG